MNRFADSGIPGERFEAVRALLSLSALPESPEGERAFGMLELLLAEDSAILEILFHNPEVSDDVRENLIQLQLERLELFRHGRAADAEALEGKIRGELESYRGSRADEFRKALEKTPEKEPRRGNGFRRRRRVEE